MFEAEFALVYNNNFKAALDKVKKNNNATLKTVDSNRVSFLQHMVTNETLLEALDSGNADAAEFLTYIIQQSQSADRAYALHLAISNQRHDIIGKLVAADTAILDKRDANGLTPLALAIKNYRETPTALTLSIINQIYFSIPKGPQRNNALAANVLLDGDWVLSSHVWEYAMKFCIKYDERGKPQSIDLNWLDLVHQAIGDGMRVMGNNVDLGLFRMYFQNQYGDEAADLLQTAERTLSQGLPGRTNAQTKANSTLARNSEFTKRADYKPTFLAKVSLAPTADNIARMQPGNWILAHGDNLYYAVANGRSATVNPIPRPSEKDASEGSDAGFDKLLSAVKDHTAREAITAPDILHVINMLKPREAAAALPMQTVRRNYSTLGFLKPKKATPAEKTSTPGKDADQNHSL